MQLNYNERQEVVDIAFRFLAKARNCPVIVAGDLGVGLPTVHAHMRRERLEDEVKTHCTFPLSTFHTLFRSFMSGYKCTSINTDSGRMIAYQIEISSGDKHPTAEGRHRRERVALTPRQEVHLKTLQQLTDGPALTFLESGDALSTVELLYQPIAEQTRDKHGVVHTSPIDVDVSGNTFVLSLIHI